MSTKRLLTAILVMTSLCRPSVADPISEEMKCLDIEPQNDCSVIVSYPEYLDNMECNDSIPTEDGSLLKTQPRLVIPDAKGEFPVPVLVLMFDPDIPSTAVGEGFVHWLARGKLEKDGEIRDLTPLPELEYYPPSPPEGDIHRYQIFVFHVDADKTITDSQDPTFVRLDRLCVIINRNSLPKPIASTQFRYRS